MTLTCESSPIEDVDSSDFRAESPGSYLARTHSSCPSLLNEEEILLTASLISSAMTNEALEE